MSVLVEGEEGQEQHGEQQVGEQEVDRQTDAEERASGWRRLRNLAILLVVVVAISAGNHKIRLSYYVLSPGGANTVKNYVHIDPAHLHPEKGKVLLATVGVVQATPFDWLLAHVTPGDDIISKSELLGPQTTQQQYAQENQELMSDSQLTAIQVAMNRAGYKATLNGDGGLVDQIDPTAPANGKLNTGDVITAVNGQAATTADAVVALVQAMKVGEVAHLDVTDSKKNKRTVDVTLGARPETGTAYIGIGLETVNPRLDKPFDVTFKDTGIGGPSAGLAFTLTVLDELTTGDLTGGQTIATTGTIASDGSVGPVGGVKQKTHAVEAAGAKIFLVPTDEYADAKKAANKSLTVIPVDTLDQAISALATHGGDVSGLPQTAGAAA